MIRLAILLACAALALGACRWRDESTPATKAGTTPGTNSGTSPGTTRVATQTPEPTPPPGAWDPGARATARKLADALAAGGLACDDYAEWDYEVIAADYARRLPVPGAMSKCVGPEGEDITFEVFADDDARDDFYATKMYIVCRSAEKRGIKQPELPRVAGPGWLVEPDEAATADRIAEILAGTSLRASCPGPTAATTSGGTATP